MEENDYYDYKQSRRLSSFKHALIVVGIAFVSFMSFQFGTMISQESEKEDYVTLMTPTIKQKIEVGQTWSYNIYKNDPFKQEIKINKKVIGVKNNYVLFVQTYNDSTLDKDTISEDTEYFLIGSELLSPIVNNFKLKYITVDKNASEYKFRIDFKNLYYEK